MKISASTEIHHKLTSLKGIPCTIKLLVSDFNGDRWELDIISPAEWTPENLGESLAKGCHEAGIKTQFIEILSVNQNILN